MGVVKTKGIDKFPVQGQLLNARVEVCFNYDTTKTIKGTIVRSDMEDSFETILKLDDGRFLRDTECQYSVI